MVLRAAWKKIVCTTVDISVKTDFSTELLNEIKVAHSPAAQYVAKYARRPGQYDYLWDELAAAAWLDPNIITKTETRLMDVDIAHGPNYGYTLTWSDKDKPVVQLQPVEIQVDLDTAKFNKMFVDLLSTPTPKAH
jgi:inosine-uridine nucleoside N-ribohydrolase